ncbi:hypothetical protein HK104_001185 [Borealophlyctis nickersoniae]|nr:hypothetical protein HK104_001185 [Borealophlyctis nickersoniae]
MKLSVSTAKYILVPVILAIFIIYSGYMIYLYLVQNPAVSITLIDEPPPIPVFACVLPYGQLAYNLIEGLNREMNRTFPWAVSRHDYDSNGLAPSDMAQVDTPPTAIFNITARSWDTTGLIAMRPDSDPVAPNNTVYVLNPGIKAWTPRNLMLSLQYNRDWTLDPNPIMRRNVSFATCYVLGSRLTDPANHFLSRLDLNLANYPADFKPRGDYFNRVGTGRDINPMVMEGQYGTMSHYGIKPYKYTYLNGSSEYFYETVKFGTITSAPDAASFVTMTFKLGSSWITQYQEIQTIKWGQTAGDIAAAFQLLLLTGLVFLFGPGRFSPYGLIHRVLPDTAIKKYQPIEDTEAARMRYFLTEYLDMSPLGVSDPDLPPPVAGAPLAPRRRRTLPVTAVSIASVVLILSSFIMLAVALFGGSKMAESVDFLVIDNSTDTSPDKMSVGLGLWGYCRIIRGHYNCEDVTLADLFGTFTLNSTIASLGATDLARKTNPISFLILLSATVFMALAVASRIVSFWLSSLKGTSDVVAPTTASLSAVFGFISFVTCFTYYNDMKHSAEGIGLRGTFGIAVALVGIGTAAAVGGAVGLWYELWRHRRARKEFMEWKRSSIEIARAQKHSEGERSSFIEGGHVLGPFRASRDMSEEFPKRV